MGGGSRARTAAGLLVGAMVVLGGAKGEAAPVTVVAAENFYGDIVQQLGGDRVSVTSLIADAAIDPHEYEPVFSDAKGVSGADLVVENGGGYDDWMDKLLGGSPRASRIVLKAYDLAELRLADNEHVWYWVDNAESIARAITAALTKLDPAGRTTYAARLQAFVTDIAAIKKEAAEIRARWSGTPIALTETIFLYQTGFMGLKVLTPKAFQMAVAEGNDPPADAIVAAEDQVRGRKVKVLVYNAQTVSPITARLLEDAKAAGIPVVSVTETMPTGMTYQTWMLSQLKALRAALGD